MLNLPNSFKDMHISLCIQWFESTCCVCQESGGSARTDYRAIQLAKKKKQRGPSASPGETNVDQY